MQVQNTTDHYISFVARTNPGAKTKGYDPRGNEIMRDELPQLRTVTIPGGATVEVDDALWNAATNGKPATRQGIEMEKVPVQLGSDDPSKEAKYHVLNPVGDGKMVHFNPVMELVRAGDLKIVEHAKSEMTLEDLRKAVELAQGYALPKEVDEEKLQHMYNVLCK